MLQPAASGSSRPPVVQSNNHNRSSAAEKDTRANTVRQKGCHKAQSEPQRQPPGAVRLWPRGKGTFGLGSSGQGWAQQHGDMRTQHAGSGAPFAIAPRRTTGGSACGSRAAKLVTCAEYTRFISKCRLWFLMEGCRRSFPPPITRASRGGSGCTACLATTVGRWGSTGTRRCRQDCSPNSKARAPLGYWLV